MKHIATFESINSKTDVEDLMLYFEDKGDIRNLKITVMVNNTTEHLLITCSENI